MLSKKLLKLSAALLAAAFLPAVASASQQTNAVYALTNTAADNRVMIFERDASGHLQPAGAVPTGGAGTGGGLGSQGALALAENDRWLLAVNAGSDQISVFSTKGNGLTLTDKVWSHGHRPISVTTSANLVYVLNAGGGFGGQDSISGFYLTKEGHLIALPGSTQALSAANVGPAQVSFAPSGDYLVVTEKGTNRVDTFWVNDEGVAGAVHSAPAAGVTPFGFAFTPSGAAIVSEAWGGAPGASTISSYIIGANGWAQAVTAALADTQTAACWVAVARNGKFAYVANTGSNTVTGVRIAKDNSISLLEWNGVTASTGLTPIDAAVSDNDRYLYVRTAGDGSISQYLIEHDGQLRSLGAISGLPASAVGLVAR
ncbi:MAG: beta-propeller fold lactonase family protein [Opitutus sp.]